MTRVQLLICAVVVTSACDNERQVMGPTNPPVSSPPPQTFTLSGTVYEHGPWGQRPLANVPLDISPGLQPAAPRAATDSDGRYVFTGPPSFEMKVRADSSSHHQPCRAALPFFADLTLDVHVVPGTVLSTSGIPPSVPVIGLRVSGQVTDRRTRQPVAGATIAAATDDIFDYTLARTLTDSLGRYVVCGLIPTVAVYASAEGYVQGRASVTIVGAAIQDFELTPR